LYQAAERCRQENRCADGPTWDAGDADYIVENYVLKKSCDRLSVPLVDLFVDGMRRVKMRSFELMMAQMAFDCDPIISLPVLKAHGICDLTGALKNHIGFLTADEKRRLHYNLNNTN